MHLEIKRFKGRKDNRITPTWLVLFIVVVFFITNYISGLQCKSGPRIVLKPGFTDVCHSHLSIVKK